MKCQKCGRGVGLAGAGVTGLCLACYDEAWGPNWITTMEDFARSMSKHQIEGFVERLTKPNPLLDLLFEKNISEKQTHSGTLVKRSCRMEGKEQIMKRVTEITVKEFKELGKYLPDPEKHGAPFDLKVTKTTRIGPMAEKTETKMYRFKPNTPRLGVKGNWIGWFFSGRVTDYNKPGLEPLYALGICKIEDTVITQEKPAPLTIGTLKEGQYAQSVDNPTFFYRRDKGVVEYFDIAPDSINGLKWTRSINCTPFNLKPIWFGKVKDIPEGMVCRCADLRELVGKYRRKGGEIQYYDSCGDWSWSGVNSGDPNKDDLVFKIGKVEPVKQPTIGERIQKMNLAAASMTAETLGMPRVSLTGSYTPTAMAILDRDIPEGSVWKRTNTSLLIAKVDGKLFFYCQSCNKWHVYTPETSGNWFEVNLPNKHVCTACGKDMRLHKIPGFKCEPKEKPLWEGTIYELRLQPTMIAKSSSVWRWQWSGGVLYKSECGKAWEEYLCGDFFILDIKVTEVRL